jgi:hypothetical protein
MGIATHSGKHKYLLQSQRALIDLITVQEKLRIICVAIPWLLHVYNRRGLFIYPVSAM